MYHSDDVITAVYFTNQTEQFSVACTCVPTILSVHDIVSTLPTTIIVEQNVHKLKGEVKAKIKTSPVVVFGVLSRMVLVRES